MTFLIALVSSGAILSSCNSGGAGEDIYVLASAANASRLTTDLAAISERHGMTPHLGRATSDSDNTTYVIESGNFELKLWGQNATLSGQENPEICGRYVEPHADPGQFVVTITRRLPTTPKAKIDRLASEVAAELRALGYRTQAARSLCSELSRPGGTQGK